MRRQFMHNHYYRDLYMKLQGLNQGSKSMDEYLEKTGTAIIQANMIEDRQATMTRYLLG